MSATHALAAGYSMAIGRRKAAEADTTEPVGGRVLDGGDRPSPPTSPEQLVDRMWENPGTLIVAEEEG